MLGSSSYSSEEDHQDLHHHNRSSQTDLSQAPTSSRLSYQFHLINSLAPSPPLVSASSSLPPLIIPSPPPAIQHPKQLLISCAELISRREFDSACRLLALLSSDFGSQTGDSAERLVHYFSKALSIRLGRHFSSTSSCLGFITSSDPNPNPSTSISASTNIDLGLAVRYSSYLTLNQVTPFVRFTHLTANQAILEAVEGYGAVHIVDMDVMHGVQWPPLLQAVVEQSAALGRLPPKVSITGVGRDPALLDMTGDRLHRFARSISDHLEFMFHPLVIPEGTDHPADEVIGALQSAMHRHSSFGHEEEVAVAVHCGEYLHRLLREYDTRCLRRFLHRIKTLLNPRILTVGEREGDHNHPLFLRRFVEAIDHYEAVLESLEATLPPQSRERMAVEDGWFGDEIRDVVAEEGERRKERHQRYEAWEVILRSSGFKGVPLSPFSLSQAKLLLRLHYPSEGYQLQVLHSNCLLLGWKNRPLYSVSSWQ